MAIKDTRSWADQERDELHRLLIYIRGVEAATELTEDEKEQLTRKHYLRVVQLNSPLDTGSHRSAA